MADETTLRIVTQAETPRGTTGRTGAAGVGGGPRGFSVPPPLPGGRTPIPSGGAAPVGIGGIPAVTTVSPLLAVAGKLAPVIGAVFEGAKLLKRGFDIVSEGLKNVENQLAPFSPDIAVARAEVQVDRIIGRLNRAEEFGPELARLTKTRGKIEEQIEELKTRFFMKLLPLVEKIVSGMEPLIIFAGNFLEEITRLEGTTEEILAVTSPVSLLIKNAVEAGQTTMDDIERNTRKEPKHGTPALIKEVLEFLTGAELGVKQVNAKKPMLDIPIINIPLPSNS